MQPFLLPDVTTFKYPLPLNGAPLGDDEVLLLLAGVVLEGAVLDGAEVEDGLPPPPPPPPPDFGRYLTLPEQVEAVKESSGTKVPVCKLPRTL